MPRRKKPRPPRVVLLETSRLADLDSRLDALSQLAGNLLAVQERMCELLQQLESLEGASSTTYANVGAILDRHTAATIKRRRKSAEPSIGSAMSPEEAAEAQSDR